MVEALSERLEGMDEFDSSRINDGMLVDMMVCYKRPSSRAWPMPLTGRP